MSRQQQVTSGGIGLGGAAFLVLFVLKVMGYIDMNWFWVLTSILWVPVATLLSVMALVAAGVVISAVFVYVIGKARGSDG